MNKRGLPPACEHAYLYRLGRLRLAATRDRGRIGDRQRKRTMREPGANQARTSANPPSKPDKRKPPATSRITSRIKRDQARPSRTRRIARTRETSDDLLL